MRITDILKQKNIKVYLSGQNKSELIHELVEFVLKDRSIEERKQVVSALFEREKISSTGIGYGVAIPHARIDLFKEIIAGFGLTKTPVDFEALDGKPIQLVFLILYPSQKVGLQIKFLARVSRLLHDVHLREKLVLCKTSEDVFNTFKEYEDIHFTG